MSKLLPSAATVVDLVDRATATFAQAFLAIEVADQTNITQLSALKVAGFAGAFAVGKFLLVKSNEYLGSAPATNPKP